MAYAERKKKNNMHKNLVRVQLLPYLCTVFDKMSRKMKKFLMTIVCAVMAFAPAFAQNFNDKADNIVGEYLTGCGVPGADPASAALYSTL